MLSLEIKSLQKVCTFSILDFLSLSSHLFNSLKVQRVQYSLKTTQNKWAEVKYWIFEITHWDNSKHFHCRVLFQWLSWWILILCWVNRLRVWREHFGWQRIFGSRQSCSGCLPLVTFPRNPVPFQINWKPKIYFFKSVKTNEEIFQIVLESFENPLSMLPGVVIFGVLW